MGHSAAPPVFPALRSWPRPTAGSGPASSLTPSCRSAGDEREVLGKVLGTGGAVVASASWARPRGASARQLVRGAGSGLSVRQPVAVPAPVSRSRCGNCQLRIAGGPGKSVCRLLGLWMGTRWRPRRQSAQVSAGRLWERCWVWRGPGGGAGSAALRFRSGGWG